MNPGALKSHHVKSETSAKPSGSHKTHHVEDGHDEDERGGCHGEDKPDAGLVGTEQGRAREERAGGHATRSLRQQGNIFELPLMSLAYLLFC
ncbi:uncharacterized [Tachysurus ichikawai]